MEVLYFVIVLGLSWQVVKGSEDKGGFFRCEPTNIDKLHEYNIEWLPYSQQMRNFPSQATTSNSTNKQYQLLDFQHRSHAGVWEFPYLLDLRTINSEDYYTETENWSNANLITSKFAITTCDAVAYFRRAEDNVGETPLYTWEDEGGRLYRNYVLIRKDPKQYKIMYASALNYKVTKGWEYEVGTRRIESFSPHPNCSFFNVDFSFGIIKIKEPLYPFPPYTNYMHVDFNCTSFQDLKVRYNELGLENARDIDQYYYHDAACTIGLWGRLIPSVKYINWTTAVVNYKLRYRVRFVDPEECKISSVKYKFPPRFDKFPKQYIECMGLAENETLGVICDHDRGAPIVCGDDGNEAVRAILLAGATKENCTNNAPQVFMVLDLRMIYPLFAHINVLSLKNITRGRILRYSGSGATLLHPSWIWGYYIIIYYVLRL